MKLNAFIFQILSLFVLAATCLFNLNLIIETNKKIEKQKIILQLGKFELIATDPGRLSEKWLYFVFINF